MGRRKTVLLRLVQAVRGFFSEIDATSYYPSEEEEALILAVGVAEFRKNHKKLNPEQLEKLQELAVTAAAEIAKRADKLAKAKKKGMAKSSIPYRRCEVGWWVLSERCFNLVFLWEARAWAHEFLLELVEAEENLG